MHPDTRLKRLRKNAAIRDLVKETRLSPRDFIQPYFVVEGKKRKEAIKSMPGISHLSADHLIPEVAKSLKKGIGAVLLFGIPETKGTRGIQAYDPNGVTPQALKAVKKEFGDAIVIFTDVCLCGYMTHGHCGVIKKGKIDYEATNKILARTALSHAAAGADFVAPSAMADGQVGAIRRILDKHGYQDTGILSYSAKYASNFYGPFREAYDSPPKFGDRKSYQMDFANGDEALREVGEDIHEGADIVMVKPAGLYLDVIYRIKQQYNIPLAAYHVSGEYALLKKAAQAGYLDEKDSVLETFYGIKRAGADLIITYYAGEVAQWLASQ